MILGFMFICSARRAVYRKKEALIGFEPMIEAYFLGLLKSLILLFDA